MFKSDRSLLVCVVLCMFRRQTRRMGKGRAFCHFVTQSHGMNQNANLSQELNITILRFRYAEGRTHLSLR